MNSTHHLTGIVTLVGSGLLLLLGSDSPADDVTIRDLPALIGNAAPVAHEPHVALIGFEPQERSPRITVIGSRTKDDNAIAQDTRIAGWLAQAVPQCRISCLPIGEEVTIADALQAAIEVGAAVIYVPWEKIQFGCDKQQNSIAMAWESGTLLLTIVPPNADSATCPVGVLPIKLLDVPRNELMVSSDVSSSLEVSFASELLRDPPTELEGVSDEILAAVYVAAVAVAIPAKGVSAHLERVAQLTLSTPALRTENDQMQLRLIDAQAALNAKGTQLWLSDKPVSWDHRFSDLPKAFYVNEEPTVGKETLRVRAAVEGDTPIRWLLAVSMLTHSRPLSVFPHGAGMTLFEFETDDPTSLLVQLLKAQPASESGGFCRTIVAFPSGK